MKASDHAVLALSERLDADVFALTGRRSAPGARAESLLPLGIVAALALLALMHPRLRKQGLRAAATLLLRVLTTSVLQ